MDRFEPRRSRTARAPGIRNLETRQDECRDQRSAEWLNHICATIRHACRSLRRARLCRCRRRHSRPPHWRQTPNFQLDLFGSAEPLLPRTRPHLQRGKRYFPNTTVPELAHARSGLLEWRKQTPPRIHPALTAAQWISRGRLVIPERLGGALVSANFFTFLGATPQLGRGFARERTPDNQMSW